MATISQTIFSDAFSWTKSFVFWLKFHWSLLLRVQMTINKHYRRQAIIWTNAEPIHWRIRGSGGGGGGGGSRPKDCFEPLLSVVIDDLIMIANKQYIKNLNCRAYGKFDHWLPGACVKRDRPCWLRHHFLCGTIYPRPLEFRDDVLGSSSTTEGFVDIHYLHKHCLLWTIYSSGCWKLWLWMELSW